MIRRNAETLIKQLVNDFPVVVILGSRQCGKSTLAKTLYPDWKYFDLENPNHFERISRDPVFFFQPQVWVSDKKLLDSSSLIAEIFKGSIT